MQQLSCIDSVMQAFVLETRQKMINCTDAEERDLCLLSSILDINHYKIPMHGTIAAFAKTSGNEKFADIFHKAKLNEEQLVAVCRNWPGRKLTAGQKTPFSRRIITIEPSLK